MPMTGRGVTTATTPAASYKTGTTHPAESRHHPAPPAPNAPPSGQSTDAPAAQTQDTPSHAPPHAQPPQPHAAAPPEDHAPPTTTGTPAHAPRNTTDPAPPEPHTHPHTASEHAAQFTTQGNGGEAYRRKSADPAVSARPGGRGSRPGGARRLPDVGTPRPSGSGRCGCSPPASFTGTIQAGQVVTQAGGLCVLSTAPCAVNVSQVVRGHATDSDSRPLIAAGEVADSGGRPSGERCDLVAGGVPAHALMVRRACHFGLRQVAGSTRWV